MSRRKQSRRRTPTPSRQKRPSGRLQGAAAVGTLALVAGYVFVSGTFVLPESPARAAVQDGFSPYFSQSWRLFAPDIARSNLALDVQAQWRDENDELQFSDWVAATDIEYQGLHGRVLPSRASGVTVSAAGEYLDRYDDLSEDQQIRVEDTFIQRDGEGGFEPIPDELLVNEVDELGDDRGAVVRLIRYDYMLTRFADAFTEAHFGEEVERVRWRVRIDRPNDFDVRADPQVRPVSFVTFGWRQPARDTDADVAAVFDDVLAGYRR